MSSDDPQIRILVVDDHPVVRHGIAGMAAVQPDIVVVAEASNGREAIHEFRVHRPDVTLMDLQMPEMNGLDAVVAILDEFPGAKIIVLTTYAGDVQIVRALKAGAQGYLLKSVMHKELLDNIRAVHAGRKIISPEAASRVVDHTGEEQLTPKELEVLRLLAAGNANKEVAAQLSIAEDTVKRHVSNILGKLQVNDRTHAVTVALKRGIIEL